MQNMLKNIVIFIGIIFPSYVLSQSTLKGAVYLYDTKEPAPGCVIYLIDTVIKINSKANQIKSKIISDFDGNFEILNVKKSSNLMISFPGYRNTIVKNIPYQDSIIFLKNIPLFSNDELIQETRVTPLKKRKGVKMEHHSIGQEGPFSHKNELIVNCKSNSKHKIIYRKRKFNTDIEVDYQELSKCNDHVYKK